VYMHQQAQNTHICTASATTQDTAMIAPNGG
jgi:hypothetical protein